MIKSNQTDDEQLQIKTQQNKGKLNNPSQIHELQFSESPDMQFFYY